MRHRSPEILDTEREVSGVRSCQRHNSPPIRTFIKRVRGADLVVSWNLQRRYSQIQPGGRSLIVGQTRARIGDDPIQHENVFNFNFKAVELGTTQLIKNLAVAKTIKGPVPLTSVNFILVNC
jgi:hypothetical protein